MAIDYLSPNWLAAATQAVAQSTSLAALANDHQIGITQVVSAGPQGDVVYHLQLADGVANLDRGAAPHESVRFTASFDNASALARNTHTPQELLMDGRVRVEGDPRALVDAVPVLTALSEALAPLRASTTFPDC